MNWIIERDKKPPFEQPVLCFCRIYGTYIGLYTLVVGSFGNWVRDGEKGVLPPTHWMPLPEPPQPLIDDFDLPF